jgi:protein-disulfide isomerase-like protein with CxxC motif
VSLATTLFTDPGCPWAYSAAPDLAVLRWRYGAGLDWRVVVIGLSEDGAKYESRGYTPGRMVQSHPTFRGRFGMPFGAAPRERITGTGPACRAIVATRLVAPEHEWAVIRALQFATFCSSALLDSGEVIAAALADVAGLDAAAVVAAMADPATEEAYARDHAEARAAGGTPAEAQGKTASDASDGRVRYTAPSVIFESQDGERLVAGGFQSIEAYDVCVANLAPGLARRAAPEDPHDALAAFDHGLTTQEVAAILAPPLTAPERDDTERLLLSLAADGRATRTPLGNDALWRAA